MNVFDHLSQWKKDVEVLAERNEQLLTGALLGVAGILILIAIFGGPRHKALAAIYIVL